MLLQPIDFQFVAKAFFFSLVIVGKIEQFFFMLKSLRALSHTFKIYHG